MVTLFAFLLHVGKSVGVNAHYTVCKGNEVLITDPVLYKGHFAPILL